MVLEQLDHTVMHNGLGQHLEFKELADKFNVANGAPTSFVLGFLELFS